MNVISVPRPATEPSMKTLLNLVMGLNTWNAQDTYTE